MTTLRQRIAELVLEVPGLTDREITDRLLSPSAPQAGVNQAARAMAKVGQIVRRDRKDGKIGNFPAAGIGAGQFSSQNAVTDDGDTAALSEDDVKCKLQAWLELSGWKVTVVWGTGHGADIDARRGDARWVIEAKGCGSRNAMRVNYFLSTLGELLQRMKEADAKYSIALPDMRQFRCLWERLPELAKSRTRISALFVSGKGTIEEVRFIPGT